MIVTYSGMDAEFHQNRFLQTIEELFLRKGCCQLENRRNNGQCSNIVDIAMDVDCKMTKREGGGEWISEKGREIFFLLL